MKLSTAVISAASILGAVGAFVTLFRKILLWIEHQREQDKTIAAVQEEQTLICYGVLACLRGLREQGCDGPVTEAIGKIEKHLNKKAHGQE